MDWSLGIWQDSTNCFNILPVQSVVIFECPLNKPGIDLRQEIQGLTRQWPAWWMDMPRRKKDSK